MVLTLGYIALLVCTAYAILILILKSGWDKCKPAPATLLELPTLSCIVAFRNEAENLPSLVSHLSSLEYPQDKVEFIFVNDHSTDESLSILERHTLPYNSNVLNSPNKGKKDAIAFGIHHAKYDYIVVTDADCEPHKNWLLSVGRYISEYKSDMLAGPVYIPSTLKFGHYFQSIDLMSLVSSGAGAIGIRMPIMCNGANLCYKKNAYLKVSTELKKEFLSGDDIFLLHAFKQRGFKTDFIKDKEAIVCTQPTNSFSAFMHQRVRWTSKSKGYTDQFTLLVAWIVFLSNLLIVCCLPFSIISKQGLIIGAAWLIKILADIIILKQVAHFFSFPFYSTKLILSFAIYPFYIVLTVFWAIFGQVKWKNRSI